MRICEMGEAMFTNEEFFSELLFRWGIPPLFGIYLISENDFTLQ